MAKCCTFNSFWTIDNCSEPIGGCYSRAFMSILRERTVDVLLQVSKKSRNSQTRDKRFETTWSSLNVPYTEKICPVKSVELSLGILDGYQNVVKIENLLLWIFTRYFNTKCKKELHKVLDYLGNFDKAKTIWSL